MDRKEYMKNWYQKNKEWVKEYTRINKDRIASNRRKKHLDNRDEENYKCLNYYYTHLEDRREKARKWKENNKERVRQYMIKWREENREHRKEYKDEYNKEHPEQKDKKRFMEYRRRVKKRNNGGSHTYQEWIALKDRYDNRCAKCGINESLVKITEDHIKPISLGGSDNIDNIQPLCQSCNSQKSTKEIRFTTLFGMYKYWR